MKVLYVANVADLYGASRSLLRLVSRMSRDGHEIHVVLPGAGPLCRRLEEAGVRVNIDTSLPTLARRNLHNARACLKLLWRTFVSAARLRSLIRSLQPDIVHTNTAVTPSPGLAAWLAGIPHVWHVREFVAGASRLWPMYQWFLCLFSRVIVCNSQATASQFAPFIRRRKVTVIHNGVPRGEMVPAAERVKAPLGGGPLAGVVGRIQLAQKGQDVFVQAASLVARRFPEAGFVICGSPFRGNERHLEELRALIDRLGLRGRFALTGDVENPDALISALDICVLPARKPEGLGNALIEAMALGKPVIGSAVGGVPEVIEHGRNGLLVAPGNPQELAAALSTLLENPGLRRRMGEAGLRRYEALFEFGACYARTLELYGSLLAGRRILGMRVDRTSYRDATARIMEWSARSESRCVCAAAVNNVMEAYDSPGFRRIMNQADLVTADGMPLVWSLRLLGASGATRVYGPDLMTEVLAAAAASGTPVGFYGASRETLQQLLRAVKRRFPNLAVAYAWPPPFRPLTPEEDQRVIRQINGSGARILFVGISTPKQERWMAEHRGRIHAVMLGVGAAFDFLAGTKPQAPRWMRQAGLEWAFRLCSEPRRLWRRYLRHNPRFVAFFVLQFLGLRKFPA